MRLGLSFVYDNERILWWLVFSFWNLAWKPEHVRKNRGFERERIRFEGDVSVVSVFCVKTFSTLKIHHHLFHVNNLYFSEFVCNIQVSKCISRHLTDIIPSAWKVGKMGWNLSFMLISLFSGLIQEKRSNSKDRGAKTPPRTCSLSFFSL